MDQRTYFDAAPGGARVASATDIADDDWGPLSDLPGNPMIWLLVLSELAVFGALFGGFAAIRLLKPEIYVPSQAALDSIPAGFATLALVTSGWLAARALDSVRRGKNPRPMLLASMAFGAAFLVAKIYEYADKFEQGINIDTNAFWTLYYLATGFHALHVVLGIIILGVLCRFASVQNIETGTTFWHMIDVIWIVLYPIIYLVRT